MTIDESIKALKSCSDCDGCLICKRVDDAMQEISRIVSCHDCIYFEPGETVFFSGAPYNEHIVATIGGHYFCTVN